MSLPPHVVQMQREYNRLTSAMLDSPRRRLTRWERVLCYIALEWPEPFAWLAGKAYTRRRARLLREGKTL